MDSRRFQNIVYDSYKKHGRVLPWRTRITPYRVLVSEIMLQQTQVKRVIPKYKEFLKRFPTFAALTRAPLRDVVFVWQGLGYNRRAIALHRISSIIVRDFRGRLPHDPEELLKLPGIGPATAASIAAFAFNSPTVFIETNIRSVFIHFFFKSGDRVSDAQIIPFVQKMLDRENPREWYYALMDYGVMLKSRQENPSRRSKHYAQQSKFKGSHRELRGKIVKTLIARSLSEKNLVTVTGRSLRDVRQALSELQREGFIVKHRDVFFLQ